MAAIIGGAPYYFASTRFRWPNTTWATTNNYQIFQSITASPDYEIRNPRFFLPITYFDQSGAFPNQLNANEISFEGLSVKINSTWYRATYRGTTSWTVDPATETSGFLLDPILITIPANSVLTVRIATAVPTGSYLLGGSVRTTINGEAYSGGASSLAAKLTDDSTISGSVGGTPSGSSNFYTPAFMIAQGKDDRPVFLVVGDSIGYGQADGSTAFATSRGEWGFISRGLDDSVSSRRMAYANFCCRGHRPGDWSTRSFWASMPDAIGKCPNIPFTHILTEHGSNSIVSYVTFKPLMETYYAMLRAEWPSIPIVQSELLAYAQSTDGFQTLANQSVNVDHAYPTGARWAFNADVGGSDGLGDPAAYFRTHGYIDDSFSPWRYGSYDTAANRDKLSIRAFVSTLAQDYTAFATTCVMNDAPAVLDGVVFNFGGTGAFLTQVVSVAGTGPYAVTLSGGGSAMSAGTQVTAVLHDTTGLHPSTYAHSGPYKQAVIDWKNARWPA